MLKKILILCGIVFILGSLSFNKVFSQKNDENLSETIPLSDAEEIRAKLDKVISATENSQKEVLSKLDQILANQEEMKKELEVVKIRCSR